MRERRRLQLAATTSTCTPWKTADTPYAVLQHREPETRYMKIEAFHANADGTKGDPVSPDYNVVYESDGEGAVPGIQVYQWDGTYAQSRPIPSSTSRHSTAITSSRSPRSRASARSTTPTTSRSGPPRPSLIDRDGVPGEGPGDGSIDEEADKGVFLYNDFELGCRPLLHVRSRRRRGPRR